MTSAAPMKYSANDRYGFNTSMRRSDSRQIELHLFDSQHCPTLSFPILLLFSLISHLWPSYLTLLASRSSPLGMLASRYPGIPMPIPPFLLESVICVGSAIILHLHRLLQFSITHKYCYCYYLYICLYVFLQFPVHRSAV